MNSTGSDDRNTPVKDWGDLASEAQSQRYLMIVTQLLRHRMNIGSALRICDVGAGEGTLLKYLPESLVAHYTAVDGRYQDLAKIERGSTVTTICANIETWLPDGRWDAIVLNEVLYYLPNPIEVFERLSRCADRNGILITSIYKNPKWRTPNMRVQKALEQRLKEGFAVLESFEWTNRLCEGKNYFVTVARPYKPA